MIDITRAQAITGWMRDPELTWLAEQAQQHRSIVELGSYLGRSTRALADNTPGVVYAIDHFRGPSSVPLPDEERETINERFIANVGDLIKSGKVVQITCDHGHIPPVNFFPDMVFVDGDHVYESVKRDIVFWQEKTMPGGLLCGHDYFIRFPGVVQAVEELYPPAKVVPNTSIWFVELA